MSGDLYLLLCGVSMLRKKRVKRIEYRSDGDEAFFAYIGFHVLTFVYDMFFMLVSRTRNTGAGLYREHCQNENFPNKMNSKRRVPSA